MPGEAVAVGQAVEWRCGDRAPIRSDKGEGMGLLKIAGAINKLNPSLGSIAVIRDRLAYGIKRKSLLGLDNTGLVLRVDEHQLLYGAVIAAGDVLIQQSDL